MLTEETVTVTTTTTQSVTIPTTTTATETMTRLTTTYITTTMTGAETTLTKTKTETITLTTTIPEVTTVTKSTIVTKTETIETVKTVLGPTETVTTTVAREGSGLRCLIATAAYGSEIAPQVQSLREFRDNFVMQTFAGSNFMTIFNTFYYSWSPYIAETEYRNDILRSIVKSMISPLISSLEISREASKPLSINPELAVLASGLFASSLISLIYFAPTALIVYFILKWRRVNIRINLE